MWLAVGLRLGSANLIAVTVTAPSPEGGLDGVLHDSQERVSESERERYRAFAKISKSEILWREGSDENVGRVSERETEDLKFCVVNRKKS